MAGEIRSDEFLGVPVRYVDWSPLNVAGDGVVGYDPSFKAGGEVLLAFSPVCHHMFVIAGDQEMHPRLFHRRAKARPANRRTIKAGFFFRFEGLSDEQVRALRDFVIAYQGRRTPSCVFGALQILEEGAGLRLVETVPTRRLYLRPVLRSIFENGFVDREGRPVRTTFYKLNSGGLDVVAHRMAQTQRKYFLVGEAQYLPFLAYERLRKSLSAVSVMKLQGG